jgi:hypothetical protein
MTDLLSIQQNAQDLLLALVQQEPLPEMRVLLSENWQHQDWHFAFAIIGESHYVRIEHQGQLVMLEVLACLALKAEQCKLYHPLQDMKPFTYQEPAYQVAIRYENHLPLWKQQTQHLRYHFPITYGQTPETRIKWQFGAGRLSWQSLHSYPNESGMVVVLSESSYQLGV